MKKTKLSNLIIFGILLLIILFSISARVFLLFNQQQLGFDNGHMAVVATNIIEGNKPYLDFFDHRSPLINYCLAFMFKITGANVFSTNLLALIFDLALLISIFLISKKFYNFKIALFASALYLTLTSELHLNTVIPMTLFGLLGIYLYIISFKKKTKFRYLFLSGFFIALSVWFKQPGILFFIAVFFHQLFLVYKKELKFNESTKNIYFILAGVMILSLPLLSYFVYAVGFKNFFYHIIVFTMKFSGSTPWILQAGKFIRLLLTNFSIFFILIIFYRKEIFQEEYPRKNLLFGILIATLVLFFIVNKEIFYVHLYQLIPFVLLLSLPIFLSKIDNRTKKLISIILLILMITLSFQLLEQVARDIRDNKFKQQEPVVSYLNTLPSNSSVFSDSPQYYFFGNFKLTRKIHCLAPSIISVFDFSDFCNYSSKLDYIIFTHRKKYLGEENIECIKQKFVLQKRFENIGESYVEIWRRKN